MNYKDIISVMDMFLEPEFSFEHAFKLFGKAIDNSRSNFIILKPKNRDFAFVQLERLELVEGSKKKEFLASIFIRLSAHIHFSFEKMTRKYGQPKKLPRLKPDSDIPYRFEVKGKKMEGNLILFVKRRSKILQPVVSGVKFTRFPQEK